MELAAQPWALGAIVLWLIGFSTWLAFRKNNAGAAAVAAACGLAAVLVFIPQVQSLEFGPLKAEMRAKIEEANATLAQLRALAASLSRVSVLGVLEEGSLGGPSYETLYSIKADLARQLIALQQSQAEIDRILKPLDPRILLAFGLQIQASALQDLRSGSPGWNKLFNCTQPSIADPSSAKFQACLKDASVRRLTWSGCLASCRSFSGLGT